MVMRKTIKKARTMQTEINDTFHLMKNSSLNFRKLTNETACIFPKFTNSRGAFHSIRLKFRCESLEISMGEWYRLFQCEKRQAEAEHRYVDIATFYTPQQQGPYTNQRV